MSYYVRLLTTSDEILPVTELQEEIAGEGSISIDTGDDDNWTQLILSVGESEIAVIERNPVEGDDSLAKQELEEFLEEVSECKPETASNWLQGFLPTITTIYAFQLLNEIANPQHRRTFEKLKNYMWWALTGIFQADGEGFSNLEGYHILWQFDDGVSGAWNMAILEDGQWINFQIDLGNIKHRRAFCEGKVPAGVKRSLG